MQSQNNRNCETCGKPITSGDPRQKYCGALCYRGGEFRLDYLKRMAAAAVKGTCTEWPYSRNKAGYGTIGFGSDGPGHSQLVHRVAYKLFVGPVPDDVLVLHNCDNPPCFSPHCLFLGSKDDNNQDRVRKGRSAVGMKDPSCKLTPEQVKDIFDNWRPYENGRELAEKYGVGMMQVRHIGRGLSQSHLFDPAVVAQRRALVRVNRNRGRAGTRNNQVPVSLLVKPSSG